MRGEHDKYMEKNRSKKGSPPHARGTRLSTPVFYDAIRITPACAGNTQSLILSAAQTEDHPRMRGEHVLSNSITHTQGGSPPHARGTLPFFS